MVCWEAGYKQVTLSQNNQDTSPDLTGNLNSRAIEFRGKHVFFSCPFLAKVLLLWGSQPGCSTISAHFAMFSMNACVRISHTKLHLRAFWSSTHLLVSGLCFKMSGALVVLLPLHWLQWGHCLGRCLLHTMEMSSVGQITLSWALGVGYTFALSKDEVSYIVCSLGESWVSVIHLAFAVGCLHAWLVTTIPLRRTVFCLTA